jgi:hypothetical protein
MSFRKLKTPGLSTCFYRASAAHAALGMTELWIERKLRSDF